MKVNFKPNETIAEISNLVISAWLVSAGTDVKTAAIAGGLALLKPLIKGISLQKNGPTPRQRLQNVIQKATQTALQSAWQSGACEYAEGVEEAVSRGLFSVENAERYLLAENQQAMLCAAMTSILERFPDCDLNSFPIEDIVKNIVDLTRQGIPNDEVLLVLETNVKANAMGKSHLEVVKTLLEQTKILHQILESIQQKGRLSAATPHWLTTPCKPVSHAYVERPDYSDFHAIVSKHRKILLHGMGGLGKTECMRKACELLQGSFAHVAWIPYTGNLKDSLTAQIKEERIERLPEKEKYAAIERLFISLGTDLLLFVDDIDASAADDADLPLLGKLEATVIITARPSQVLSGFKSMPIDRLNEEACKKLVYGYAELRPLPDEKKLTEIISLTGRHTLALEIIARAMRVRQISVEEMLEKLQENGFDLRVPVMTAHSGDIPEKMMRQLEKLYKISAIENNPAYLHVLKNFSILPYLPLSEKDTIMLMALEEDHQDALYELAELGWLEFSQKSFAMHPVVRQVVRKLQTTVQDCETLIENMNDKAMEDFFSERKYQPFMQSIAEAFSQTDLLVAKTYCNLASIHQDLGSLPEALLWQKKAKNTYEALYPEGKHLYLATSHNNLSTIYWAMGNLPEALLWQKKAKNIFEALFPEGKHSDLATSYNNLSTIYNAMRNMPEALFWQMKDKDITEALYLEGKHPSLATSYNNLSLIYKHMGNLPEALSWQMKAKNMREALFPEGKHPDLATSYNNLSSIYYAMGNLPEALSWQMQAISIMEALFPDGMHPDLATFYGNLSLIYQDMGDLAKANHWRKKSEDVLQKLHDRSPS